MTRTPDALDQLARRADPADAGAQNNLGVLLHRRGRPEAARAAFARALALDPAMTLARRNLARLGAGDAASRREAALRVRLRADGADHEARRELALLLAGQRRGDEARAECAAWRAVAPDDAAPWVTLAHVEHEAGGTPEAAAAALEEALLRAPGSATVRTQLAEVHYRQGDAARALALLDAALARAPDDADAHLLRSFVLGELGRDADAHAARRRAVALNPALGRADANLELAPAPAEQAAVPSNAPTARATTGRAAVSGGAGSAGGEPPEAHLALGEAFRLKGYLDEAERELRRALAVGAPPAIVRRMLAELALLRGHAAAAQGEAARACALAPHDARAWLVRAGAAHLAGDAGDATAAYRAVLARAATGDAVAAGLARWAHGGLALLALAAADASAATTAAASAVGDLRAAHPAHRAAQVAALTAAGDATGALDAARALVAAHPRDADAWCQLGALLADAGRPAEARGAFARALDCAPDDAAARYGLAFAHAALGDHDAARRETERALAVSPIVPPRRLHLALDLGDPQPATFPIEAVPAMSGDGAVRGFALDDENAGAALAALDAMFGPDEAARSASAEPAVGADDAWALADELLAHGAYDRAIAAVSRAIARGADRAEGIARTADAWARRGFLGEALERYGEARALDAGCRRAALGEARALRQHGRHVAARLAADACVARWPDDAEALALAAGARADGLHEASDDEAAALAAAQARALLARAESHAPRDASRAADAPGRAAAAPWPAIAAAWRALGDAARAAEAWAAYLVHSPGDARAGLAHADALAAAGDRAGAERALRTLRAAMPTLPDAALALARLLDPGTERVQLLAEVAARDPWHADAIAALGAALADDGRVGDASVAAARALRLDPEHALALAVDGDCRRARGDLAGARERWALACALEPAGDGARRARAGLRALGARRARDGRGEAA